MHLSTVIFSPAKNLPKVIIGWPFSVDSIVMFFLGGGFFVLFLFFGFCFWFFAAYIFHQRNGMLQSFTEYRDMRTEVKTKILRTG